MALALLTTTTANDTRKNWSMTRLCPGCPWGFSPCHFQQSSIVGPQFAPATCGAHCPGNKTNSCIMKQVLWSFSSFKQINGHYTHLLIKDFSQIVTGTDIQSVNHLLNIRACPMFLVESIIPGLVMEWWIHFLLRNHAVLLRYLVW